MKSLISILLLVLSVPAFAKLTEPQAESLQGSGEGNGGIVKQDKAELKLLAETNLILERASNIVKLPSQGPVPYYFLSNELKQELEVVLGLLPRSLFPSASSIIENRRVYLDGSVASPEEYAKVAADYEKALAKVKPTFEDSLFPLAALTRGANTIIFTKIFEGLSLRRQALLLIHEYHFRHSSMKNRVKLLGLILELDAQIYKYLKAQEQGTDFDLMRMFAVLRDMSWWVTPTMIAEHALETLQTKSSDPIFLEDFILEPELLKWNAETPTPVERAFVERLNSIDRRTLQIFYNATFLRRAVPYRYLTDYERKILVDVCTKYPQVQNKKEILYSAPHSLGIYAVTCDKGNAKADTIEIQEAVPVFE